MIVVEKGRSEVDFEGCVLLSTCPLGTTALNNIIEVESHVMKFRVRPCKTLEQMASSQPIRGVHRRKLCLHVADVRLDHELKSALSSAGRLTTGI